MQDEQMLRAAVEQATRNYHTYPSNFNEVRAEYQQRYGDRNWIGKLTADVYGKRPPGQSGFAKGTAEYRQASKEYYAARRNIERWEQGTRSPGAAAKARLQEIGRELPPLKRNAPPGGLKFTVDFYAPADSEHAGQRTRQAQISLDYPTAVQFVQEPNWPDLWDLWFDDGNDIYGEDGDYAADVFGVSAA